MGCIRVCVYGVRRMHCILYLPHPSYPHAYGHPCEHTCILPHIQQTALPASVPCPLQPQATEQASILTQQCTYIRIHGSNHLATIVVGKLRHPRRAGAGGWLADWLVSGWMKSTLIMEANSSRAWKAYARAADGWMDGGVQDGSGSVPMVIVVGHQMHGMAPHFYCVGLQPQVILGPGVLHLMFSPSNAKVGYQVNQKPPLAERA